MKSNIPVINEITYNALPEKALEARLIMRSEGMTNAIKKLKEKHEEVKK